jgi:hypothetical protein
VAAEANLTPHEIIALSGHKTLNLDRKKLAPSGMKKIEARTWSGNPGKNVKHFKRRCLIGDAQSKRRE